MRLALPAVLVTMLLTHPAAATPPLDPFARPGVKVERAYPLRAWITGISAIHESPTGPELAPAREGGYAEELVVVADVAGQSPRRPRVVCDQQGYRTAMWIDAGALAPAVRTATVITAAPPAGKPRSDTPGLHVAAGVRLEVQDATAGRVRYHDLALDMTGFVPPSAIDVVYRPGKTRPVVTDAQVTGSEAVLRDAPGGQPVLRIKTVNPGDTLHVDRVGRPRDGFQLVRYDTNLDGTVIAVGWIETGALTPARPLGMGHGYGFGTGHGGVGHPSVDLPRGTWLKGPSTGVLLGRVFEPVTLSCKADCESRAPLVTIDACMQRVDVRAQLP
jgi:hypothetical protein